MFKKYLTTMFLIVTIFSFNIRTSEALAFIPALAWAGSALGGLGTAVTVLKGGAAVVCAVNIEGCIAFIVNYIFYYILSIINVFALWLVQFSGYILDLTLYYTVAQFTTNFTQFPGPNNDSGGLIYYAWSIVRDILNAGVFFVIIYHAVLAMFNGLADVKKKFIALLVFVILVNFSLLMVKLVADISNIAILQIYQAAVQPIGSNTLKDFTTSNISGETKGSGISLYIINAVNPYENLQKSNASAGIKAKITEDSNTFAYKLGLLVIYFYLFFLFIYVAAILFTRAITFIVIMIASPLLVAGAFFSGFNKELQVLKNELKEEALQGPGIIFFLFLSAIIAKFLFSGNTEIGFNYIDKSTSSAVISQNLIMFIRIIFFGLFNYYAFKMVRDLTSSGNNSTEKLLGLGLGLGFGAAGWAGRKVIGGAANSLFNGKAGTRLGQIATDAKGNFLTRGLASGTITGLNTLRNASFDGKSGISAFQKTMIGGKIITGLKTGLPVDINMGKGSDSSANAKQKKKDEDEIKRREDYKTMMQSVGQDSWTISNSDLINKDLIKGEYRDKDVDIRELKALKQIITDAESRVELGNQMTSKGDNDNVSYQGVTMKKQSWQKRLNEMDEDTVKASDELKKALEKAEQKLSDGVQRSEIVAKYQKKIKEQIGENVDYLQGQGKISYAAEFPKNVQRFMARTIAGEKRDGGDFRANAAAKKRVEEANKPNTKGKSIAVNLLARAYEAKDMLETMSAELKREIKQKDINTLNEFRDESIKYTSGGKYKNNKYTVGGSEPEFLEPEIMPKSVRDDIAKSLRNIATEFTRKMNSASRTDRTKIGKFIKSVEDTEDKFAKMDEAEKAKEEKAEKK